MRGSKMDVKVLRDIPPWDWPEGTGKMFHPRERFSLGRPAE